MTVLVGTCSWSGRVQEQARQLYNTSRPTAEQLLRCYSGMFTTVEVDSTFYSLPSLQNSQLWAQRTPEGFTFHPKTLSLFTTHRTRTHTLPTDLRKMLPHNLQSKPELYPQEVPEPVKDELWLRYRKALEPLELAGKLGYILVQFAPWFGPSRQNADYILSCKERLAELKVAVEFRNRKWFEGRLRERTPEFLKDNGLTMVCVDMPQGSDSSIPPIAEATTDESYIRLHGRNTAAWQQGGLPVNNIHDYWYTMDELDEWLGKVRELERRTSRVYVMLNTVQGLATGRVFQQMVGTENGGPVAWGINQTSKLI